MQAGEGEQGGPVGDLLRLDTLSKRRLMRTSGHKWAAKLPIASKPGKGLDSYSA